MKAYRFISLTAVVLILSACPSTNEPGFSITPSQTDLVFAKDLAVTPITFTSSSKDATGTFSISPKLPDGLNFDTKSGTISGTPTAETASKTYTVSFTGSGEYVGITGTADITIQVNAGLPLSGIYATLEAGTDTTLGTTDDLLSFGRAPAMTGLPRLWSRLRADRRLMSRRRPR